MIRGVLSFLVLMMVAIFLTSDYMNFSVSFDRASILPLVVMGIVPISILIGILSMEDRQQHH